MAKDLFQKKTVEKLESPEQIDRLLVIVRVPGWIALWSICGIIAMILIWSVVSTIPVVVNGMGVFFHPQDILVVQSQTDGVVRSIAIHPGDAVQENMLLITLHNPSLLLEQEELRNRIQYGEEEIENPQSDPLQVENRKWELIALKERLKTVEWSLQELSIRSPVTGTVLDIEVLQGQAIRAGSLVLWLQKASQQGEKELFYSFYPLGSPIREGMTAFLQFEGIDPMRYGKMVGRVLRVLPFAASRKGEILQSIPSEQLREFLTAQPASLIVEIEPTPHAHTPSGYQWTTQSGPPYPISRGSVATVSIVVENKHPISYLFPGL